MAGDTTKRTMRTMRFGGRKDSQECHWETGSVVRSQAGIASCRSLESMDYSIHSLRLETFFHVIK